MRKFTRLNLIRFAMISVSYVILDQENEKAREI